MKINVGCGKQTWDDFYCIDAEKHPRAKRAPDLIHAFEFGKEGRLLNPIPLDDSVASELHNYHFIEHFFEWEAPALAAEFYRLLKPGGRLIMELPNIEKAARNLVNGSKEHLTMWPLYGDPGHKNPYMCHKWGYTNRTIKALLKGAGFGDIHISEPITHGCKTNRDMRVTAIK